MKYQLQHKNYNEEAPELALHDLLVDRHIENPVEWLHPTVEKEYSPFRMTEMKKAIDLLHTVIQDEDARISVVVDSDLDGYTSGAIIISLLNQINKGQAIKYILHPGKEHGIELKDISDDTDLIIVPDAGSSQKAEHIKLLSHGTKVIILDHHEIDNDLNYAEYQANIALVSSQRDYPNPALSGAGVALKFIQAYAMTFGIQIPNKLYSLAACGIIADVMDMSYLENKRIVQEGISHIAEHPFLMGLVKKAHFNQEKPEPSIKDIGWVIGPNINSIIRLGTMEQKHIIFNALTNPMSLVHSQKRGHEDEEVPIYIEAMRLCDNAKKRQTTAINRSISLINSHLTDDMENAIVYVDEDQELTFELSGLIANKLLSDNNKPVLLLKQYQNDDGTWEYRGSARGKPAEGLLNLKDTIKDLTGVQMAEGHAFAFGIGIDYDSLAAFKMHLDDVLSTIDFNTNLYLVDLITHYKSLNLDIATILASDNTWCHGVDKPLAVLTDIPTTKYEVMGANGQHMKIDCGKYDIVFFNVSDLVQKLENGEQYNLNVVGEFDIDKAYNIGRVQFIVKDYDLTAYKPESIWDYVF